MFKMFQMELKFGKKTRVFDLEGVQSKVFSDSDGRTQTLFGVEFISNRACRAELNVLAKLSLRHLDGLIDIVQHWLSNEIKLKPVDAIKPLNEIMLHVDFMQV
jgi:hypothetical protein